MKHYETVFKHVQNVSGNSTYTYIYIQILQGSNGQTRVESNMRVADDATNFATCSMLPQGWVVEGAVCLWAEKLHRG